MIAIERACCFVDDKPGIQMVLVFGVGLIGETLMHELLRRGFSDVVRLGFSWLKPQTVRDQEADAIFCWVKQRVRAHKDAGIPVCNVSIAIVWSAGRGGFASTWAALDSELNAFQAVIALSLRLLEALPLAAHNLHLMSSAGGLYEGQLNVGPHSMPEALRPYGELKLEQERQLLTLPAPVDKFIYRPSSVYGFVSLKSRLGLIATLIKNGIFRQVSTIFAEAMTLRDYVLLDDVVNYMAWKLEDRFAKGGTFLLASAKPTSINEVLVLLERLLDQSLYFVIRPTNENTASNTFSACALADGFLPQALETGMRSVLLKMQHQSFKHDS